MTDEQKIAILREQITSLRSEVGRYSDSQRTIARYAIVGVAAVVVLRRDLTLDDFQALLPVIPILAMGMVAVMVLENVFIFRTGRWLAATEKQLEVMAGSRFLQYEQDVQTWRLKWMTHRPFFTALFVIVASGAYFASFAYLLSKSELRSHPEFLGVLWSLAVLAYIFALMYFVRMIGELKAGIPALPLEATVAHAPEGERSTSGSAARRTEPGRHGTLTENN